MTATSLEDAVEKLRLAEEQDDATIRARLVGDALAILFHATPALHRAQLSELGHPVLR
jgi:hypothetical protein